MELLWLLLNAAGAAIVPTAIVGSVIGGVVGNRADAMVMAIVNLIRKKDQQTNQTLGRSVQKAFLLAQMGLAQDCLEELLAKDPRQDYRGMVVYEQFPNEIRWLETHLKRWKHELAAIDKSDAAIVFSLDGLAEVEALLGAEGQSAVRVQQVVREKLYGTIPGDAPQIYLTRATMDGNGLWERLGQAFGAEIQENQAIAQIFESQILVQINAGMKDQQIKLEDLTQITIVGTREILARLDAMEARWSSGAVVAAAPSLVVKAGQVVKLANPFFPLTGRVDDEKAFFPRSKLVNDIFELLNSGSSVALIGPAKSGKSSVLREIERSIDQLRELRKPVFLDLSQVNGDEDFYNFLCEQAEIVCCRGTALTQALNQKRLLLLLDEADTIAHDWFTEQIRLQLRGLANSGALRMVVAAREDLDRAFPDSTKTSPFQGLCLVQKMGVWNEHMVRTFIAERLQGHPVQFREGEIRRILEESAGLPGEVMRACFETYREYQESV